MVEPYSKIERTKKRCNGFKQFGFLNSEQLRRISPKVRSALLHVISNGY